MTEYWKERLSFKEQAIYRLLRENITSGLLEAQFKGLSNQSVANVIRALELDHPEFYFIKPQYRVARSVASLLPFGSNIGNLKVELELLYSISQIGQIGTTLSSIASGIQQSTSGNYEDIEKAICRHIIYSTDYSVDINLNQNAASALYFHKAQCSGIAKAVKYLMDRLGKWCIVVLGSAKDNGGKFMPHAWNIVHLNNSYYHLDVTSMLGTNLHTRNNINFMFFNCSDKAIQNTHQWDRTTVPHCTDEKYDYLMQPFQRAEKVREIQSAEELRSLLHKSSGESIQFIFKIDDLLENQQEIITKTIQNYGKENRFYGKIKMSFVNGIWRLEFL